MVKVGLKGVKAEGVLHLFCINEHCPEECSLKSSLFSLKLDIYEVIIMKLGWNYRNFLAT